MEETLHFGVGDQSFKALLSTHPFIPINEEDLMLICDSEDSVRLYKAHHGSMHLDSSEISQNTISILRSLHPFEMKSGDIIYVRLMLVESDHDA